MSETNGLLQNAKNLLIGAPRDPHDKEVFHHLSLIAFLAWVGLGADGISSSCYGPEETFRTLGSHSSLSLIVGLISAITVFVIASSYSQIIELFPSGGGGYLVASKLLSPNLGMISGCALLVDYVLTITISIASGADALFSFFPPNLIPFKIWFAVFGVLLLTFMNLRGVKEAVVPLVPIFLVFIFSHAFIILYALVTHLMDFSSISTRIASDFQSTHTQLGAFGMFVLIMKAYSMSAGTYTGIEAVSNGLPILKEPKVETGKKTMMYMAVSLATIVLGLMVSYLFYEVQPSETQTLNAVLCGKVFAGWGTWGSTFLFVTLFSEAALLFVAAQAGFLDGPRVLANMAQDRWFPTRFSMLSDRLVTQNGILLMGISSLLLMVGSRGSVSYLVVLYSINVFITFTLSQLGMVKHWWTSRNSQPAWAKKLMVNGLGLLMTAFILFSVVFLKFHEGGWITFVITGSLILLAVCVKKHYNHAGELLMKFQSLVDASNFPNSGLKSKQHDLSCDLKAKTAVVLVNGYNGQGLHALLNIAKMFDNSFKNFVFIQIGMIDTGNFKGIEAIESLEKYTQESVEKYVEFAKNHGFCAEGFSSISVDVVDETMKVAKKIQDRYQNAIFFGGQLVFPEDTFWTKLLHNHVIATIQQRFFAQGLPLIVIPVRI